jgi:hypothetical protein
MSITPLQSLVATGTKLWLDSIDPQEVAANREWGASGATSNPIIVSDLIKTGRFDDLLSSLLAQGLDDETIAWQMTDHLVREAQKVFRPVLSWSLLSVTAWNGSRTMTRWPICRRRRAVVWKASPLGSTMTAGPG